MNPCDDTRLHSSVVPLSLLFVKSADDVCMCDISETIESSVYSMLN